jgi:hypothetical protein
VVEQPHRIRRLARHEALRGAEALGIDGAGDDGEALPRHAEPLDHLLREALAADQQRIRMVQHVQHAEPVRLAAGADPVPVAALDGDDGGDADLAGRQQHRPAIRVAILRMQDVEGLLAMLGRMTSTMSCTSRSKSAPPGSAKASSPRDWRPMTVTPGTGGGGPPP